MTFVPRSIASEITADRNGVLFVCVANSARSQMAEGLARAIAPESVVVYSAGRAPSRVNPAAISAMDAIGIDIRSHTSKSVDDVPLDRVAVVITLCAEAECPVVLTTAAVARLNWSLPDPAGAPDEPTAFAEIRDELQRRMPTLFA